MKESEEDRKPDVGEHDEEDSRGGGGGGGLSGAAPGADEASKPGDESSVNEPGDVEQKDD